MKIIYFIQSTQKSLTIAESKVILLYRGVSSPTEADGIISNIHSTPSIVMVTKIPLGSASTRVNS